MNEDDILEACKHKAHEVMLDAFGSKGHLKEDFTPVTNADIEINQFVIDLVRTHFPNDAVLGEERAKNGSGRTWVVDPIDGTTPFTHKIPTATCSIAIVDEGTVKQSMVHDPWTNRTYTAKRGQGTYRNGKKCEEMPNSIPKKPLFYQEVSLNSRLDVTKVLRDFEKEHSQILRLQSTTYATISMIERGGYVVYGGSVPWDAAGVSLLVEEVGGRVTDFTGRKPSFDGKISGVIMAAPKLHETVLNRIKDTKAYKQIINS